MSKVLSLSLHQSGRLLLVVYENNMFRLWNLLDGRCSFKKKVGLDQETSKIMFKVLQVKWEPSKGQSYALLFDKKVEVYSSEKEEPLSSVTSEVKFVSMDFVND